MTSFIWRGRLKVSVGEMSRAAALDMTKEYNSVWQLLPDNDARFEELQTLVVLKSPVKVTFDDKPITATQTLDVDGVDLIIGVPLTRDLYNALPLSLTNMLADAAVAENQWVVEDLKNAVSRSMPKTLEPQSGSVPSPEPTTALLPT